VAAFDRAMRDGRLPSTKPTPAPVRMPASTKPIAQMTVGEIAHELRAGAAAMAGSAVISDAHRDRRQQLWQKIDALVAAGRRAAP
jgi:hypothetical protein